MLTRIVFWFESGSFWLSKKNNLFLGFFCVWSTGRAVAWAARAYNRRGATDFCFLFVNNNKLIEKRTKKVDFFFGTQRKKNQYIKHENKFLIFLIYPSPTSPSIIHNCSSFANISTETLVIFWVKISPCTSATHEVALSTAYHKMLFKIVYHSVY